MKIFLAWLQLTHEKMRFLVALAGIAFADVLMFIQLGFQEALFESSALVNQSFRGDIFLLHSQSDTLIALKSFSQRRLYQSLGVEGVASVSPVYFEFAIWKNPVPDEEGKVSSRALQVIAFNPKDNVLNLPGLDNNLDKIKLEDVVLFDDKSRPEFGPIPELLQHQDRVKTEVASRGVTVRGLFSLGASFGADGNIITSDLNFLRIFAERDQGLIEIGIINIKPGAEVDNIITSLRNKLPEDVKVFSRSEFIEHEKKYWQNSTAIGFIFTLGAGMGFIVGTVIVYQILYSDVVDHLPEYATLKAMGYTDNYLLGLVFQEAIILALFGYVPGYSIASILYFLAANATNLPIAMVMYRAILVMILTIMMCFVSGAIAVHKLSAADPADIF